MGSEISNPSCSSSPWMRGAPQDRSSDFMRRIRCLISRLNLGRPRRRRRDRNRKKRRNPVRCQHTTVYGLTMIRAFTQSGHKRRSATQNARSSPHRQGRGYLWLNATSCWRSSHLHAEPVTADEECAAVGERREHERYYHLSSCSLTQTPAPLQAG